MPCPLRISAVWQQNWCHKNKRLPHYWSRRYIFWVFSYRSDHSGQSFRLGCGCCSSVDPFHLILGFQSFGYALGFLHLLDQPVEHCTCNCAHFLQVGIQRSLMPICAAYCLKNYLHSQSSLLDSCSHFTIRPALRQMCEVLFLMKRSSIS